jgi:hypothetical protein
MHSSAALWARAFVSTVPSTMFDESTIVTTQWMLTSESLAQSSIPEAQDWGEEVLQEDPRCSPSKGYQLVIVALLWSYLAAASLNKLSTWGTMIAVSNLWREMEMCSVSFEGRVSTVEQYKQDLMLANCELGHVNLRTWVLHPWKCAGRVWMLSLPVSGHVV